jgi:peptidoglycan glycosyltransferase
MNRTIRRAAVFTLLLVAALLVRATWVQGVRADALAHHDHNRRDLIEAYAHPLGDIIVAGEPVTGSVRTDAGGLRYKRGYTDGKLYAPVTGHRTHFRGSSLLEGVYHDVLDGTGDQVKSPLDVLTRNGSLPGDVVTTIDPDVQRAGYEALQGKTGAAVAVDPETGRLLAVVSTPSYDPSAISGSGQDGVEAEQKLQADDAAPMTNRALRRAYAPGSTFKLVVAVSALEHGLYDDVDEPTDSPAPYTLPHTATQLTNEIKGAPCEDASIRVALQWSCNTVFAKMAADLGKDAVRETAQKLGFGDEKLDVPVRAAESVYPTDMNPAQTALTGIGQFEVRATPLQMAMVSQAIANGGVLVHPHEVATVQDADGSVVEDHTDPDSRRVMSADTAAQLRDAMRTVVEKGTGTNAQLPGLTVGGKTGTAQHGVHNSGEPYAWFTSWAQDGDGHRVAVAVVVTHSDTPRASISGNGLAAPVAADMISAALGG